MTCRWLGIVFFCSFLMQQNLYARGVKKHLQTAKNREIQSGTMPDVAALDRDFPDTMVLKLSDGFYSAYASERKNRGNQTAISVSGSKDLHQWDEITEAMPEKPVWANKTIEFWTPHVVERCGVYDMYYSAQPDWSAHENMQLGVATSRSRLGPFHDMGAEMDTTYVEENIDPMFFADPIIGKDFLYWGMNGFIHAQELEGSLNRFAVGSHPIALLGPSSMPYESVTEAPFVIFVRGYYCFFYSGDDCCETPHCAVMVTRSKSPLGPFEKLTSQASLRCGVLLEQQGRWMALGHNSVIADSKGSSWIICHALDSKIPATPQGKYVACSC